MADRNYPARAFPNEEYDRRIAAVRREMAARDVDGLLLFSPANLFYLTGYNTAGFSNYACLLVSADAAPVLVVRQLERAVAEMTTGGLGGILAYEDHERPADVVARAVQESGLASGRLAAERNSPITTVQSYFQLQDAVGREMADGSGIMDEVRVIKSPLEVGYIRTAARCSEAGMRAAVDAVAEGRTENYVAGVSYAAMAEAGSEYLSSQPIVTAGAKSGIAHTTFHRGHMRRGDTVLIEIGAAWERYSAPLMRTVVVGAPSRDVERMHATCIEALEGTIAAIRPGVTSAEVQGVAQGIIDRAGYGPHFRKRIGYSVGGGFPPTWGEGHIMDIKHNDDRPLRPGMVFHIPPALREHRQFCMGVSETVVVTEQGAEVLTSFSRELFVR